ncbi:hypothetical protein SAMN05444486_1011311 [Lentibacter algarum]|jgi:hypothetical protein|uniref:Cyclic nucleotide-binding domain-containing protein n=1 Tax=Lentibacter algarum TaxID=576131 RepID=A0A1H3IXT1_9RHOB|nr:hypothetical protein [Lentibacter algarum]SDY31998.1 hypothetical protein SAMN05444486_1011311 [Lentibacter algarum]
MHSSFINSLSLAALPRHRVQALAMLLEAGSETDRVFLLKKGRALGADGVVYQEGQVLNFKEFLAASHFLTPIKAQTECDVVHIPRDLIRERLCIENPLTWTIARCFAVEDLALRGTG